MPLLFMTHHFSKDWGKTYNLYTLNRQTGNYDAIPRNT